MGTQLPPSRAPAVDVPPLDLATQYFNDYVMGNFWSAHWPQPSHFRHHLLMCRHPPTGQS